MSVASRIGCAFLFIVIGSAPCMASAQDASVVSDLRQGAEAMHSGDAAKAETFFRQAVAAAPKLAEAHLDLGLALLREGRPKDAVSSLKTALALNPQTEGVNLFLGIAEYQLNQPAAAVDALKQEIALHPHNVQALTWLGIVDLGSGDPDAAIAPLDEAAKLAPDNLDILDYRGQAHSQVAAESYRRMRELAPDSWHVHRALAQNDAEMGKPEEAIQEYKAAIARQPMDPDLYESLGEEYQRVSKFDAARSAYEQELKLSHNNPIALYNIGKIDVQYGDTTQGVSLLRKATPLLTHPAPGYFYLGLGLVKLGQYPEALQWLQKSLENKPSDFIRQSAYFQLIRVCQQLHRTADAQRYTKALQALKTREASAESSDHRTE